MQRQAWILSLLNYTTRLSIQLENIVNQLDPISLEEMDAIQLMSRQDTKYVFHENKLPILLEKLSKFYKILEIDKLRLMSYSNVYFDTKDFDFYHKHHNGRLNRFKIRNRSYVESDLAFCELKYKTNKKRTNKTRVKLAELESEMSEDSIDFLKDISPIPTNELLPVLYMDFNRITLAHRGFEDRCTIDFNLVARNDENEFKFENIAIAEIKQEKFSAASAFNQTLKSEKILPMGFSKYCIGVAATYKDIKQNRFKPKFLTLNKLMHGTA